jgi:membrane fusion protein, multidrug efflux system
MFLSMPQAAAKLELLSPVQKTRNAPRIVLLAVAALLAAAAATGWAIYSDAQIDGHLNVVSARIAGTTAGVHVTDNQSVEAEQPLVDLDPSEQQVAYAQARRSMTRP